MQPVVDCTGRREQSAGARCPDVVMRQERACGGLPRGRLSRVDPPHPWAHRTPLHVLIMQWIVKHGCLVVLVAAQGCVTVKAYEREHLASRSMEAPHSQDPSTLEYRDKVLRTRTGGSLPAAAPAGGCGCTQ